MLTADIPVNQFKCGNCFEELPKLPDGCIDLVLTDPPYGIDYQSNRRTAREKLPKFANDCDLGWVDGWVEQVHRVLKDDRHFYCFTRFDMYPLFYASISRLFKVKNCLIWVKNNHGSGDLNGSFAPQHEMIIFATKGRRDLNGPRDADIIPCDNVPSAKRFHATQKPVLLLRQLIEKSTDPDELVLDPFAGTGSTGLACKAVNIEKSDHRSRDYYLIELNRDFRDTAVRTMLGSQEILLDTEKKQFQRHDPKSRHVLRISRFHSKKDSNLAFSY
jgi:site-specific DNA-methyltransferase (adenine-specific)